MAIRKKKTKTSKASGGAGSSKVAVKKPAQGSKTKAPAAKRSADALATLRERIDKVFNEFFTEFPRVGFGRSMFDRLFDLEPLAKIESSFGLSMPAVDLVEKTKEYTITAELPGMSEKDLDLSVRGNLLTIKGEKKEERETKDKDRYVSERRYGSFQRSFRLPDGVDEEGIDADFKNGVLTIRLPKTREAQKAARKISVSSD